MRLLVLFRTEHLQFPFLSFSLFLFFSLSPFLFFSFSLFLLFSCSLFLPLPSFQLKANEAPGPFSDRTSAISFPFLFSFSLFLSFSFSLFLFFSFSLVLLFSVSPP